MKIEMKGKMTTDSHRRGIRDFERDHNTMKVKKEDAKTNGIQRQLRKEEYERELAELREKFNNLKMMIEEDQRWGFLVRRKMKWHKL